MLNYQTIQAKLETKFQGLRKDGLEYIARAIAMSFDTEEAANEAVEKMKEEDVKSTIADWRKTADSEISKAIKTNEEGLRAKYDFTEKGKTPDDKGKKKDDDEGKGGGDLAKMIADAIAAANAPLMEKIAAMEGKEVTTVRRDLLNKELENLPTSFKDTILDGFNNRKFANDEEFNTYLEATKTSIGNFKQELSEAGLSRFAGKPGKGSDGGDGVDAAVAEFVKSRTEQNGSKAFEGKAI